MKMNSVKVVFVCFLVGGAAGCRKIDDFKGTWSGQVVADESVRKGFPENVEMDLNVTYISPRALEAVVSTCHRVDPDTCTPGLFQQVTLGPVEKARNDDLRNMTFGGEPYAVHLMTAQPTDPAEPSMLVFVSLHSADRVEVRLVRANEMFGVFKLSKK